MSRAKATQMPLPTIEAPTEAAQPRRGRRVKGETRLNEVLLPDGAATPAEAPATFSKLLHNAVRENLLRYINPNTIDPNPHQPRRTVDEANLQQLISSIRERGILQPILVARGSSARYVLVAGQRRLEAARRLGLARIPAMIIDHYDSGSVVDALIENIQRVDLSDMDTGETFRLLQDEYNWTQEEIARRIGKDQSYVSNHISVVRNLSPRTKQLIAEAGETVSQADEGSMTRVIFMHTVNRELARLSDAAQEAAVLELIATQPATTRQAQAIIRRYKAKMRDADTDVRAITKQSRKWQVPVASLHTANLLHSGQADGETLLAALEADLAALRAQRAALESRSLAAQTIILAMLLTVLRSRARGPIARGQP